MASKLVICSISCIFENWDRLDVIIDQIENWNITHPFNQIQMQWVNSHFEAYLNDNDEFTAADAITFKLTYL